MSLLSIVQRTMRKVGITPPSIAFYSTDETVQQIIEFAQEEVDSLARDYNWAQLKVIATYTGDGTSTTVDLPVDFFRFQAGEQMYLTGDPGFLLEPVSDAKMIEYKTSMIDPLYPVWRRFGDQIEFYPALSASYTAKLEYRSEYAILDEDGVTRKKEWEADTDTVVIPERLIILGAVWRYKQSRGFDYAEDMLTYGVEKDKETEANNPSPVLHMRKRRGSLIADAQLAYPWSVVP